MTQITRLNIVRHELIGLNAQVLKSLNRQLVGLRGRIVDESRNMLTLRHDSRETVIPKDIVHLRLRLPGGEVAEVDGRTITGRPEDRVKKRLRRW
ncbi:MAG: ribonuclease P protein component 1 [Candidatus Bathyarchaeia archaeon]